MTIALTILKAVGWRGLALIAALASLFAWHLHSVQSAKEAGRVEVRQQWAEAQRRADIKQMAKVEAQQKQISAADAALDQAKSDLGGKVSELEAALQEERTSNETQGPKVATSGSAGNACPRMPERVRNAINALGHANR
ncbi:secretion protein HylD [Agrobacterium vitis]|uniref:secretion protein HylD n=1 Tax=Agrobacterium vitis TaxID=373 RepID=UPI0015748EDD|nr:secretion protein HylD [Agrobacterium vitis]NSZ42847.1 secretion protein HylD [Agrobacterium vitis]